MRRVPLATLLVVSVILAGCGSGDGEGSRPSISATLPERSSTLPSSTAAPAPSEPGTTTPTSAAPTSAAPPTVTGPTITAPTITAPTTTAPTTAPTTTAPVTTEATTTTGATTTASTLPPLAGTETEDDSSVGWWPWALAAVVVAGLVAALLVRRSRRRAATESRTNEALTDAEDLAAHLAVIDPGSAQTVVAQDASRLASLAAELDTVAAQGSDPRRKAALDRVSAQAHVLHQVVDSVALSPSPPTDAATGHLREQASLLHTVATQARAELQPVGSSD